MTGADLPTVEGRALADLGAQVSALRAELRDLQELVWDLRPTAEGHDCPFCQAWEEDGDHGEDCPLPAIGRALRRTR